jgi:uncharacterized metal-binding protein
VAHLLPPFSKFENFMIFGIPLFHKRVAPRCKIADSILVIKKSINDISYTKRLDLEEKQWIDILKSLIDKKVDTLVCGGITFEERKIAVEFGISIIDNVSCSDIEIINAIKNGELTSGFGFSNNPINTPVVTKSTFTNRDRDLIDKVDCLVCPDQRCLIGKNCDHFSYNGKFTKNKTIKKIIEFAADVSNENERTLCRLSELVYYLVEMNYTKIGIAYCIELSEPTSIVTQVLRRFFNVFPICCKVGGNIVDNNFGDNKTKIACNPQAQAEILNTLKVDFNIIIGLCVGIDSVFTEYSHAPVSTLFVKDKSLANNPIGAIYSEHYLEEATNNSFKI